MKWSYAVLFGGALAFGIGAYMAGYSRDVLALIWGPIAFAAGYLIAKFAR